MQVDANDVINNLTLKVADLTRQLAISEVRAEQAEKQLESKNEEN